MLYRPNASIALPRIMLRQFLSFSCGNNYNKTFLFYLMLIVSRAHFTKRRTAGEECFKLVSAMPKRMLLGGETGIFTTSHCQLRVISSFMMLMPRPFSTICSAE